MEGPIIRYAIGLLGRAVLGPIAPILPQSHPRLLYSSDRARARENYLWWRELLLQHPDRTDWHRSGGGTHYCLGRRPLAGCRARAAEWREVSATAMAMANLL
jgi:hypothetical protein